MDPTSMQPQQPTEGEQRAADREAGRRAAHEQFREVRRGGVAGAAGALRMGRQEARRFVAKKSLAGRAGRALMPSGRPAESTQQRAFRRGYRQQMREEVKHEAAKQAGRTARIAASRRAGPIAGLIAGFIVKEAVEHWKVVLALWLAITLPIWVWVLPLLAPLIVAAVVILALRSTINVMRD